MLQIWATMGPMGSVGRAGRPWRRIIAYVIERDGGVCQLRGPGCTLYATTGDHIIPVSLRPDLELVPENVRASCRRCNLRRGVKPAQAAPAGPAPSPRWIAL